MKLYKTRKIEVKADALHQETQPDGTILVGYLEHDQDCANPCKDCDGMGQVRSLSRRHIDNIDADEAAELLKTDAMVVALSYFEHGLCLWDVAGGANYGACSDKQWDGVTFAGVWVPDQVCRDEILSRLNGEQADKAKVQEIARVLAAECCAEYTRWANGECFGYIIERYSAEGEFMDQVDSCWGFIGREYAEQELTEAFGRHNEAKA